MYGTQVRRQRAASRAPRLLLVLVATLVAALWPSTARAQTESAAAALASKLDGLTAELAQIEDQIHTNETARAAADDRLQRGEPDYEQALDAEIAAQAELARYSVAAYVGGDDGEAGLGAALLAKPDQELTTGTRRVLTTTVHTRLVDAVRAATTRADALSAELQDAQVTHDGADTQLATLAARRDALSSEIATTRFSLDQARAAEAVEAAKRAQRDAEDRLRAGTPRPESLHSGIIPPPSVQAGIIAKFSGEIPRTALDAYWHAAKVVNGIQPACQVDWALIAAIGRVETAHGTYRGTTLNPDGSTSPTILGIPLDGRSGTARIPDTDGGRLDGDPVYDRAVGPMQFIPSTWNTIASDGNGDGVADPHNIYDAAVATGKYLCTTGGGPLSDIEHASRAVYAYNRSYEYNIDVLTLADHYRRTIDPNLAPLVLPTLPVDPGALPPPASPPGDPEPPPDPTATTTTTTAVPPSSDPTTTAAPTTTAPPPPTP